jgi:N-carbamoyl-L-amino-acid hydrolase
MTDTAAPAANLAINSDRLWDTIQETAAIGATPKGGICRLALSEEDRQVRDWFRTACEAAGCTVTIDALGNMFARREGRDPALPPIAIGSHLDTQPTGGRYDGIIGVLAGLEVLRSLNDGAYQTNAPIELINWTNEEGARFAPAMLASGTFAGVFTPDYAYARADRDGISFGTALDAIGYRGDAEIGHTLAAHFELHIEQGPILEAESRTIGVVTGVQSIRWYEATLTGLDGHAGATPMRLRRDALLGVARMIEAVHSVAMEHAPDAVGTVGMIENKPNSRNVVPGEVFFTVDLRHPHDDVVAKMDAEMRAALAKIATENALELAIEQTWESPAVHFNPDCIAAVRRAAEASGFTSRDLVSGAGHDSAYIARVAPTTMIFVPCAGGLSHNEAESAEQADVAAGATVLLRAVLDTDQRLIE